MRKLLTFYLLWTLSGCTSVGAGFGNTFKGGQAPNDSSEHSGVKTLMAEALQAIEQGDLNLATQRYKAMQKAGVHSPDTLNQYAILLRQKWHLDEALRVYKDALSMNKNYALTHWNLAIYYELYRGDYRSALDHYRNYQRLAPSPDPRVAGWITDLERRVVAQS
jgi:tetratricopeptide (TPR) repeat protein